MSSSSRCLAALLLSLCFPAPLIIGCIAHESGSRRGDDDSSDDSGDKGGGDSSSDDGDTASVKIRHKELPDAIRENSDGGRPRHDPVKLRQALCEGYQDQPKIFYHLTVSTHWHYYWICSEERPYRVSTKRGSKNLESWLRGFKKQASVQSQDCSGSHSKALNGNHESGIQAVAHCDGRIVLSFPDGGQTQTKYRTQAGRNPEPDEPGGARTDPVDDGTTTAHCPPCPACPRGRECPVCESCPPQRVCPTRRACPQPPPCPPPPACPPPRVCPPPPPCNCQPAAVEAGKKAFRQGVDRACKRICDMVYKKCRSINPNTALCYQVTEYCAVECPK
jgi:hypothetical protein